MTKSFIPQLTKTPNSPFQVIVRETVHAFNEAYASNESLRNAAFDAAVEALSHTEEVKIRDPVGDFFRGSFNELAAPAKGQSLPASSFAGLVNAVFETHEKEFLDRFTVRWAASGQFACLHKNDNWGMEFNSQKLVGNVDNDFVSLLLMELAAIWFSLQKHNQTSTLYKLATFLCLCF